MSIRKTCVITGALIGATVFFGLSLVSSRVSADDTVVDDVILTVPVACTLSGTGMNTHNATINPGSYETDIGTTTLKAFCNDADGFAIYAIGFTDDTDGKNVLTNSTLGSNYDIVTGTSTSGNSQWAMKLSTQTSPTPAYPITIQSSFGAYHTVPNNYMLVASRDSATDVGTGATGSTLTSTYQVYISTAQPAGTYTGQVKYVMVHPENEMVPHDIACADNMICYNPNTNIKEGTMGQQSISTSATTATLLASNFSRDSYGFAGWNTKPDYSGTFYGPNEDITFTAGAYSSGGLPLYAVWVKSSGNLQGWTGCSGLTKADVATDILNQSVRALTDQRDGQTYAVAKLADGNCWIIENLRLESTNSDNSTGALAQGYGTSATYGNFGGLADAESANFLNSTTANSLYYSGAGNQGSLGATINIGATENPPGYRMPRYNNTNTSSRASNPTTNETAMYSYGNYYTWSAAMANTIYYNSPTAQDADGKTSETVNTSLCPTGWRLPYGRDTGNGSTAGGFSNLDIALGGTGASQSTAEASLRWRKYPNNFLYSGYFDSASADNRGSDGYYWSSTAFRNYSSYNLYLNSSNVSPGTNNYGKYSGRSIRCLVGS